MFPKMAVAPGIQQLHHQHIGMPPAEWWNGTLKRSILQSACSTMEVQD